MENVLPKSKPISHCHPFQFHYGIPFVGESSETLFKLWLSCADYKRERISINELQLRKKHHVVKNIEKYGRYLPTKFESHPHDIYSHVIIEIPISVHEEVDVDIL